MQVILQQNVHELGLEGDIVKVSNGYARNYLIPKGIAVEATSRNIKIFATKKKKIEVNRIKAKEAAEKIQKELEGLELTLSQKAGEEGKLYGSITSIDIAAELEKQGVIVQRRKILLEKPIKSLGEFDVGIKLHPDVTGLIRLVVTAEKED